MSNKQMLAMALALLVQAPQTIVEAFREFETRPCDETYGALRSACEEFCAEGDDTFAEIEVRVILGRAEHRRGRWIDCFKWFSVAHALRGIVNGEARRVLLAGAAAEGRARLDYARDVEAIVALDHHTAPTVGEIRSSADAVHVRINTILAHVRLARPKAAGEALAKLLELRPLVKRPAPPRAERLAALIDDLHSDALDARDAATTELTDIGPPAVPALKALLAASDPEASSRAAAILAAIERVEDIDARLRSTVRIVEALK